MSKYKERFDSLSDKEKAQMITFYTDGRILRNLYQLIKEIFNVDPTEDQMWNIIHMVLDNIKLYNWANEFSKKEHLKFMSEDLPNPQELPESKSEFDSDGVRLIKQERNRQMDGEGYTHGHDDQWTNGELANAASCYAETPKRKIAIYSNSIEVKIDRYHRWPWMPSVWKDTPNDRVRELVKAGALIAAEIDRLKRK